MKFHKQLYRHEPHNEIYGDCHRTAIACLLDLDPHQVPHFGQMWATGQDIMWRDAQQAFLRNHGLSSMDICFHDHEAMFGFMKGWNPHVLYMVGGQSPRGTDHTVIAAGGEWLHDPHPDGGFLVAPMSDSNLYEATFLIPISMTRT